MKVDSTFMDFAPAAAVRQDLPLAGAHPVC
jgi:hypothetical protein